jgi:hypothetical protein
MQYVQEKTEMHTQIPVKNIRKRQIGKPKRIQEDNIKSGDTEIGWQGVDCNHLARDMNQQPAAVNMLIKFRIKAMGVIFIS